MIQSKENSKELILKFSRHQRQIICKKGKHDKNNMTKFQTYRSPKIVIKQSSKGGKGLFAKEDILQDEIIAIKNGHIVATDEAMKLDKEIGDFSLQISEDFYICPKTEEEVKDIVIFINHSCNPNIGMDGQISYVAMRNIQKGEELCLDYAMTLTNHYKLDCNCGSNNCRRIVTGNDWKNEELQKRYNKYFSWFIYKKIHNLD